MAAEADSEGANVGVMAVGPAGPELPEHRDLDVEACRRLAALAGPLHAAEVQELDALYSATDKWSKEASKDLRLVLKDGGNLEKFWVRYVFPGSFPGSSRKLALHLATRPTSSWLHVMGEFRHYYVELALFAELTGPLVRDRSRIEAEWRKAGRPTVDYLKSERDSLARFMQFWQEIKHLDWQDLPWELWSLVDAISTFVGIKWGSAAS